MAWQSKTVDGRSVLQWVPQEYQDSIAANIRLLSALAAQANADFGYTEADTICRIWGCADAANLTLANALISSGASAPSISGNVIPAMTSANTPAGYVVAASSYTTGYDPYKGANRVYGDPYNQWVSLSGSLPQWWSIALPAPVYGLRYRIKSVSYTDAGYAWPTAWQLQGWNGSAWVTLDTRSGQAPGSTTWFPDYTIAAPGRYSAYRMYLTASSNAGIVHIDEFELYAVNAATITGNSYAVSGAPTKGRLLLRATNNDGSGQIDLGNAGSNKLELYQSINGNSTWSAALAVEGSKQISGSTYDIWTPEFDVTGAAGIGFKLNALTACNFSVDHVIAFLRSA